MCPIQFHRDVNPSHWIQFDDALMHIGSGPVTCQLSLGLDFTNASISFRLACVNNHLKFLEIPCKDPSTDKQPYGNFAVVHSSMFVFGFCC